MRDADHHHPEAPHPLSLLHVAAGDRLRGLALLEVHYRDPVVSSEPLDRPNVGGADPPNAAGEGIGKPRSSKNRTTCTPDCNLGMEPARKTRSTELTWSVTRSRSRLAMVATAAAS
jgi:hypothetical protein